MSRRILAVFAHPDDETYGPCGALAAAARHHDTRVRLLIATRGEAGSLGISKNYTRPELARIRQWEMLAAAEDLGAELTLLGYPDGGLSSVPEEELLGALLREIRLFRPQVLVTFHPNGLSGHPDHRCITRLTRDAGYRAADPPAGGDPDSAWAPDRLWYFALSEPQAEQIAHRRRVLAVSDAEITISLNAAPWLPVKHRMAARHATQVAFYDFLEEAAGSIDAYWSREVFVLGEDFSASITPCNDLFYGMESEIFRP